LLGLAQSASKTRVNALLSARPNLRTTIRADRSVRLRAISGRPARAGAHPPALSLGLGSTRLSGAAVGGGGPALLGPPERVAAAAAGQQRAGDEERACQDEADVGAPSFRLALPHGRLLLRANPLPPPFRIGATLTPDLGFPGGSNPPMAPPSRRFG